MTNNWYTIKYISGIFLIWFSACSTGTPPVPEITTDELQQHIEYLSSDSLGGRYPGTEGDRLAAEYILGQFMRNGLTPEADGGFQYFTVTTSTMDHGEETETMNVVASLRGSDPVLKNEYIVIGAHYDHLGTGGEGTGSREPGYRVIHPGADDNASGVAAMIEISEKLASERENIRRSFIFAAFGAEEKGLLGSSWFTRNPVVELESVKAMINLDMVGRKNEDGVVQIGGVGSSAEGEEIVTGLAADYGFNTRLMHEGFGPSDHASFFINDIPVFFVTTGAHPEYHTPADTAGLINYEGLQRISYFVTDLAFELGNRDQYLTFTGGGTGVTATPGHGNREVSLGIMPDFAAVVSGGLRADYVIPERPADLAGMKQGDVIVAINGNPVNDIHEYMDRLNRLNIGDIINVEVLRNDKREILIIQL